MVESFEKLKTSDFNSNSINCDLIKPDLLLLYYEHFISIILDLETNNLGIAIINHFTCCLSRLLLFFNLLVPI